MHLPSGHSPRAEAGLQIDVGHNYWSIIAGSSSFTCLSHSKGVWLVIIQNNHFLITFEASNLPKCHLTKCCAQKERERNDKLTSQRKKKKKQIPQIALAVKAFSAFCASSADSFSFQGLFFLYILVRKEKKVQFSKAKMVM